MELEDSSSTSSSVSSSSNELSSSRPPAPATKRKAGRRKFRETRHPVYRGVRQRNGERWVCEVREPHKKTRLWLGTFPTPEMAARAHDVAVIALRGPSAPLNFPDSAGSLPRPSSASPDDIRIAAVEAAEMFRPNMSSPSVSGIVERTERVAEEAPPQAAAVFVDDEELFNMPALVDDMAAGMMLTPPAMQRGFDWNGEEGYTYTDMSLWND